MPKHYLKSTLPSGLDSAYWNEAGMDYLLRIMQRALDEDSEDRLNLADSEGRSTQDYLAGLTYACRGLIESNEETLRHLRLRAPSAKEVKAGEYEYEREEWLDEGWLQKELKRPCKPSPSKGDDCG